MYYDYQAECDYFRQVDRIKHYFIQSNRKVLRHERNKIWARWIITTLSHRAKNPNDKLHGIISPSHIDSSANHQMWCELVSKGTSPVDAVLFIRGIEHQVSKLPDPSMFMITHEGRNYTTDDISSVSRANKFPLVIASKSMTCIMLTCEQYYVIMPLIGYNRLHKKCLSRVVTSSANAETKANAIINEQRINYFIWRMGRQYQILDGHSLQWAGPSKVLAAIQRNFIHRIKEPFASPVNYYFSDYGSLFNNDAIFGSRGNFFRTKCMTPGVYYINPPFIEELFINSADIIVDSMDSARANNKAMTVIYIMPHWVDSIGYIKLSASKYFETEIVLKPNAYYYYDHMDTKFIKATFSTHVIILSTNHIKNLSQFRRSISNAFSNVNS